MRLVDDTHWVLAPTATSLSLYLLMMASFAVGRRARPPRPAPHDAPFVSVLKPVAGIDEELEDNLASFAAIRYPHWELLFGVADLDDPALAVLRRFVREHPDVRARVVHTQREAALNPKVAQLVALEAAARGDVIVVSDANVRVRSTYLSNLVRALHAPRVALVTNLVAGTGERTLGAALENVQLGAMVAPGVLACATLARRPISIGKSMAMWRRALRAVGGFRAVGDVLAEDHMLARRFAQAGYGVRVSASPVENRNVNCGVGRTLERHTRWSKMRRAMSPVGFALEPLLSPALIAALVFIVSPGRASGLAFVGAEAVEVVVGTLAILALRGALGLWTLPAAALRPFVVAVCWASAWFSRRVEWRGRAFVLRAGSRIVPLARRRRARWLVAA